MFFRSTIIGVLAVLTAGLFSAMGGKLQAEEVSKYDKYQTLQSALSDCRSAWTQAGRKRTLKTIESNGTYIATRLNPIAADADVQGEMLKGATAALSECGRLVHPRAD